MQSITQLKLLYRRLYNSRNHSGAGEGIPIWRMINQAFPYYFNSSGYAKPPMTVFISINGRCNLKCRMCDIGQQKPDSMFYQNLKGTTSQDFPIERFKSLIDEFAQFRYKPYIGITTTEPLMYNPMWDAVAYAKNKGILINISTNGLLLEKHIDAILDSGLHRISISLDGPPDIHDEMRGMKGLFNKVIDAMKLLDEKKKARKQKTPHVYVTSFICDMNYQHLVSLMEILPGNLYELLNMKLMVFFTKQMVDLHNHAFSAKYPATASCFPPDFNADTLDIDVLYEQTMEIKRRFKDKCSIHFEPDKEKLKRYFYEPHVFMDSSKCVFPWFITQITNEGKVIIFTRCYNIIIGDIMGNSFLDVWNCEKMRDYRRDLKKFGRFPGCARCDGVLFR